MKNMNNRTAVAAAGSVLVGLALACAPSAGASAVPGAAAVIKGSFSSVSAASPADAWAVGCSIPESDFCVSDLAEHWNGRTWRHVAVPAPAGSFGVSVADRKSVV